MKTAYLFVALTVLGSNASAGVAEGQLGQALTRDGAIWADGARVHEMVAVAEPEEYQAYRRLSKSMAASNEAQKKKVAAPSREGRGNSDLKAVAWDFGSGAVGAWIGYAAGVAAGGTLLGVLGGLLLGAFAYCVAHDVRTGDDISGLGISKW